MAHHRHPLVRWTFGAITAVIAVSLFSYVAVAAAIVIGVVSLVAVVKQYRSMR